MSAMNKAEEKNISKEHEIYLKSVKASKRNNNKQNSYSCDLYRLVANCS